MSSFLTNSNLRQTWSIFYLFWPILGSGFLKKRFHDISLPMIFKLHPRNQKNMMTPIPWKPWFRVNLVCSSCLWTYFKVIQTFHQKRALLIFTNNGSLNLMEKLRKSWNVNYSDTLILSKFEPFLYHLASPKPIIIKSLCHF